MRGVSGKEWRVLSDYIKPGKELVERYGSFLAQLISNRGFDDGCETLFDLKLRHLLPYSLIPNVEEGIERIIRAVRRRERIILFGDYDVDGITGTAILYEILREAGAKVVPVLPSRGTGYGLSTELISVFSRYGDLLVTIDNGTSAVREIDSSGMDVIVIDHHNVPEEIPKKAVLINPKLSEEVPKDMKELSSSAICFYMGVVLARRLGLDRDMRHMLDLVALGTIGDVMPLNRTNRILVAKGISLLEGIANGSVDKAGVRALLRISGIKGNISAKDIAYSLAPRINAPGRVSDPKLSLALLTEKDEIRANLLAKKVEALNAKRKAITDIVFREAYRKAKSLEDSSFITLWDQNWHIGVLGIVAGRLSNIFGKPVAVFSKGKNHSVGSVRSIEGVDIYEGLKTISHMFLKWGGHTQAAGLTLESKMLEEFSRSAEEIFSNVSKETPPLYIDLHFSPKEFSEEIVKSIKKLEPYGEGNPIPIFLSEDLKVEDVRVRYRKVILKLGGIDMICWDSRLFESFRIGDRVRVAYSYVDGEFNVVDVKEKDGSW